MSTFNGIGQVISLSPLSKAVNETYTYQSNNLFYASVNPNYLSYFNRVIRPCAEWLDGFVPGFHREDNGIFSTRLANSLICGMSNQIVGKKLNFKKTSAELDKKVIDFFSHEWQKETRFRSLLVKIAGYYLGLGTAAIKLNKTADAKYWLEALRLDYFVFSETARDKLLNFKSLVRIYKTTSNKENHNYVLVEERFLETQDNRFKEVIKGEERVYGEVREVPKVVYRIYKVADQTNTQTVAVNTLNGKSIDYKSLPTEIKNMLHKDYGGIMIDVEETLPFGDGELGVRLVRGEEDISSPTAGLGVSLLLNIITELATYDLAWSYYVRDMYLGKGTIGIPKNLSQSELAAMATIVPIDALGSEMKNTPSTPNYQTRVGDPFNKMNLPDGYEVIPSLDAEKQKPIVNQFDLREQQWEATQNNILRRIATKIGLSPKVIATYLSTESHQKTATEIDSENDSVVEWIERKRSDIAEPVNEILNLILNQNGFVGGIELMFSTPAFVSRKDNLEFVKAKYESGFIGIEEAIQEINPDLDSEQLDALVKKALVRQQEIKDQRMKDINGFGEFE